MMCVPCFRKMCETNFIYIGNLYTKIPATSRAQQAGRQTNKPCSMAFIIIIIIIMGKRTPLERDGCSFCSSSGFLLGHCKRYCSSCFCCCCCSNKLIFAQKGKQVGIARVVCVPLRGLHPLCVRHLLARRSRTQQIF